jgi:mycothiol synthase
MIVRAPTIEDLPALTAFFATLDEVYGYDGASEAELRDWFQSTVFDPAADFRIGLEGDRIVGWCDVWDQNRTHDRFFVDVRVHPRKPAIYDAFLDWADERARGVARPPASLRASANSANEVLAARLQSRGFRVNRHFFTMEIDLAQEPPEPEWPEGIAVRTFRLGDARALYEANNEAFADHWDFVPTAFDEWSEFFLRSTQFDETLCFLAREGGQVAGYALCRPGARGDTGRVSILGVPPPWRRRGLARALLLHSFGELRRRGRTRAELGVDSENTTGAVRLYERAGMQIARRTDSYELRLS